MFYVRNFLSIVLFKNSFNCHIDPEMDTIMTPFYSWGNCDSEKCMPCLGSPGRASRLCMPPIPTPGGRRGEGSLMGNISVFILC